jgi:hypothetical protein
LNLLEPSFAWKHRATIRIRMAMSNESLFVMRHRHESPQKWGPAFVELSHRGYAQVPLCAKIRPRENVDSSGWSVHPAAFRNSHEDPDIGICLPPCRSGRSQRRFSSMSVRTNSRVGPFTHSHGIRYIGSNTQLPVPSTLRHKSLMQLGQTGCGISNTQRDRLT